MKHSLMFDILHVLQAAWLVPEKLLCHAMDHTFSKIKIDNKLTLQSHLRKVSTSFNCSQLMFSLVNFFQVTLFKSHTVKSLYWRRMLLYFQTTRVSATNTVCEFHSIGHFWVTLCLCFETSLCAKPFIWKSFAWKWAISSLGRTHFHERFLTKNCFDT